MEAYLKDFERLNKEYLVLVSGIAKNNQEFGKTVLGLTSAAMDAIANLSLDQIERISAHPHLLQYKLRFSEKYWEQVLEVANSKTANPHQLHVLAAAHAIQEEIAQ